MKTSGNRVDMYGND